MLNLHEFVVSSPIVTFSSKKYVFAVDISSTTSVAMLKLAPVYRIDRRSATFSSRACLEGSIAAMTLPVRVLIPVWARCSPCSAYFGLLSVIYHLYHSHVSTGIGIDGDIPGSTIFFKNVRKVAGLKKLLTDSKINEKKAFLQPVPIAHTRWAAHAPRKSTAILSGAIQSAYLLVLRPLL